MAAALGDIVYRDTAAGVWKRLPGNTVAVRKFLRQLGTGGGSAVPAWDLLTEEDFSTSDITTNNVSITKHGFVPKLPNDATKYLDGTGAFSVPSGGGGGTVTRIRKTSDQTLNNSTSLQNDADFAFAVAANKSYFFVMRLLMTSATTTVDWKADFTGPAGFAMFYGPDVNQASVQWNEATVITTNPAILRTQASTLTWGGQTGGVHGLRLEGFITTGVTSGTVQFRWAQNSLEAVNIVMKANSTLWYEDIT